MAQMKTLKELYIHELQDLYNAEGQLEKALPKVIDKASSKELVDALSAHLEETKTHRSTVKALIESHGEKAGGEVCDAMKGLIKETDGTMEEDMTAQLMDAALIACCQRVEHYEMAGYGTCRAYAQALDLNDDVKKISEIFDQENTADSTLTKIAVNTVNPKK